MTELEIALQAELEQEQKNNRELFAHLKSREKLYTQELEKISNEHTQALQAILKAMQNELSSAQSSVSKNGLEEGLTAFEERLTGLEEQQKENSLFLNRLKDSWNRLMDDIYGQQ